MVTQEPTETREIAARPRWPRVVVVLAALVVVAVAAIGIWAVTNDGGPVAAEDARIELTFTGDEASYAGDAEIVEGTADVVFVNESDLPAYVVVQGFDTGSAELEAELANAPEGSDFDANGGPQGEILLMDEIAPGSATWPILLEPGTYFVEAATAPDDAPTHVWRTAVIEVVAD